MKKKQLDPSIVQMTFRIHMHDHKLIRKLLYDDGLSVQKFFEIIVHSYLHGDPVMLKMIKQWKDLQEIPTEHTDSYTLSRRERQSILDEIGDISDK